jgi:hypothetical protein
MSKLKQQLPDREALEQQFEAVLRGNYNNFISSTHVRRQAVIGSRKYALLAAVFTVAVIIFLFMIREGYGTFIWNFFIACAIFWLLVVLFSARRWLTDTRLLAKEVNMALAPLITSTLNRTTVYSSDPQHHTEETRQLLVESALLPDTGTSIVADDMFTVYGCCEVSMRELVVTKTILHEKGMTEPNQLFKGVLVVSKLPFIHAAETYISTEGDRAHLSHRTFWSKLFGRASVQDIQLEWNEFESVLHVASSDGAAAREVLTPDFMHDLYTWWQEHQLNMRIAIKQNMFYMLLPEASIRIGSSTASAKPEDIRSYAHSLIRPLWRSLVLVEDVSDR